MDFSFSEEQQMLQESVQKFVQRHYSFEARRAIVASEAGYSPQHWALFAELGWLMVPFREEDGGFGARATDLMVLMEAFGRAMVVEPFIPTAVLGGGLIAALGSAAQKDAMLGKIMEGSVQIAVGLYEEGSRFNLTNVQTCAQSRGEDYVLDGSKILVLNGSNADQLLVSARTAGEPCDAEGISLFLIDANSAGVHRYGYPTVDGHRAAQIRLDGVKVPASALLGPVGGCLPALEQAVDRAALCLSAEAVGAMDALLQKTVEYSKTRKQFGAPLSAFQALQHRMANMFIECQLARSIVLMAAMKLDSDIDAAEKAKAVSAAKSRVGRAIRLVGQEAVQLHGGIGITDELDVGHLFKRITAIETLFGNTDFHTRRFASL